MASRSRAKHGRQTVSSTDLRPRIDRARRENRWQQALELSKSLFKQDPSADNLEVLQQTSLGRARQLHAQGHLRDAAAMLALILERGGTQTFLDQVGAELAACGDVRRALEYSHSHADGPARERILSHAVDAALAQGAAGRALLPEALRTQFDAVLSAFARAESGQDEQARADLQNIGLHSPFLEWKLLLRGLLAYYHKDDARALENWQRLDVERLPGKLAAPLRFVVDPAFRQTQAPEVQTRLHHAADRLAGSGLVQPLRRLAGLLADQEDLAPAFQQAETLVPALRQQAPELVGRLAHCYYWAIIHHGDYADVNRYRRLFGGPAEDPSLDRLEALAMEHRGVWREANHHWQKYDKTVTDRPGVWPDEQRARVRALIWKRMGDNARHDAEDGADGGDEGLPFALGPRRRREPLKPAADACYRRSLELAADVLDTHEALAGFYLANEQLDQAEKAGRDLLAHFPKDVNSMVLIAGLCHAREAHGEALQLLQGAAHVNPLDRELRGKVSTAHLFVARDCADAGRFDEARTHFQAVLALSDGAKDASVLCKWAACEYKAKNAGKAEELIQQARALSAEPAGPALALLIEAIRFKLPAPLKKRFAQEWETALAQPASAAGAVAMLQMVSVYRLARVRYTGQKNHEKKVLAYLDRAQKLDFTEEQLAELCTGLVNLQAAKQARFFIRRGRKSFAANPAFLLAEADLMLGAKSRRDGWRVQGLLEHARQLAAKLSNQDQKAEVLDAIQLRQEMIQDFNPLASLPRSLASMMFSTFDEFEEDDEA